MGGKYSMPNGSTFSPGKTYPGVHFARGVRFARYTGVKNKNGTKTDLGIGSNKKMILEPVSVSLKN